MVRNSVFFFCFVISVCYEKSPYMFKALVPKLPPDLSVRLKDVAEKQVPALLKPIVAMTEYYEIGFLVGSGRRRPPARRFLSVSACVSRGRLKCCVGQSPRPKFPPMSPRDVPASPKTEPH